VEAAGDPKKGKRKRFFAKGAKEREKSPQDVFSKTSAKYRREGKMFFSREQCPWKIDGGRNKRKKPGGEQKGRERGRVG